jgi:hypothetical protein
MYRRGLEYVTLYPYWFQGTTGRLQTETQGGEDGDLTRSPTHSQSAVWRRKWLRPIELPGITPATLYSGHITQK